MKKGFTLIELLAVIAILAIIMLIATPKILDTINSSRDNAFSTNEKTLIKVAELYIGNNPDLIPEGVWDKTTILYSDMKNDEYLSSLVDAEDKSECSDSRVVIEKTSNELISYEPILICNTKYKEIDGIKPIKNFTGGIFINHDTTTTVNVGEIYITSGTISFYDKIDVNFSSNEMITSHLEGTIEELENVYLMYIGSDPTRFTSNYNHDYFMFTKYDSGTWYYSDNNNWQEFITNSNDYIMGKITKDADTSGLTDFYYYY